MGIKIKDIVKKIDNPICRQIIPYSLCCGGFMWWELVQVTKYGASMIGFWYFFVALFLGSALLHYCYK